MTDLGTLGGSSSALDINSKTQVVGFSFLLGRTMPPFRHAFLWENGTMLDLNHLIPSNSTPFELIAGENINDRGEIVALGVREGCFPDFCGHIFLLIPCGVEAAIESCDNGIHDTAAASQDKVARSMVNPAIWSARIPIYSGITGRRARMVQRYRIPITGPKD
jgi:probable HAF family extracellular repeat protein